ncbi:unnamed protein product, partial [Trichogramma brassicae]
VNFIHFNEKYLIEHGKIVSERRLCNSGGLQSKSRRMAKKGQPAALQADVTNDEEWNKIVERPGLVEAKARRKYEAKMSHYLAVLDRETYIVLFPWIFTDEEGKKRDKKHSPPYLELIDQLLPGSYSVEQEIRRDIDDELIAELIKETNCNISDDTRHLMKDGKAMVLRLKYTATRHDELDSVTCLINLLYKETDVPETTYELVEDCASYTGEDLIQDETELQTYLKEVTKTDKASTPHTTSVDQPSNLLSSFWSHPATRNPGEVSPLLRRCAYQLAPTIATVAAERRSRAEAGVAAAAAVVFELGASSRNISHMCNEPARSLCVVYKHSQALCEVLRPTTTLRCDMPRAIAGRSERYIIPVTSITAAAAAAAQSCARLRIREHRVIPAPSLHISADATRTSRAPAAITRTARILAQMSFARLSTSSLSLSPVKKNGRAEIFWTARTTTSQRWKLRLRQRRVEGPAPTGRHQRAGTAHDEYDSSAYLYVYAYTLKKSKSSTKSSTKKQQQARRRERMTVTLRFRSFDRYEDNLREASRWRLALKCLVHKLPVPKTYMSPTHRNLDSLLSECPGEPKKLLVMLNPKSGPGRGRESFQRRVHPILSEADLTYDVFITRHSDYARDFVRSRDLSQWSGLVLVGGDGIVFEAINGLLQRPDWDVWTSGAVWPIAVIPCGSGNGLAKSIAHSKGEPYDQNPMLISSLSVVRRQTSRMDLVRIETRKQVLYSFLSVGWGLLADIDIESERLRAIGGQRFTVWSFARLIGLRTYRGTVSYLPREKLLTNGCGGGDDKIIQDNGITHSKSYGDQLDRLVNFFFIFYLIITFTNHLCCARLEFSVQSFDSANHQILFP